MSEKSDIETKRREGESMQSVAARMDRRASTLARMAGNIASGIEANPSCDAWDSDQVAERAVDIATAILNLIDLRSSAAPRSPE